VPPLRAVPLAVAASLFRDYVDRNTALVCSGWNNVSDAWKKIKVANPALSKDQIKILTHKPKDDLGVRLAMTYPEIAAMQVRAILDAACVVKKEGHDVHPEPLFWRTSSPRKRNSSHSARTTSRRLRSVSRVTTRAASCLSTSSAGFWLSTRSCRSTPKASAS
jgi:hypothetical protein